MRYIPLSSVDKSELDSWIARSNEILEEMQAEPDERMRKAIIHRNRAHWREQTLLDFLSHLSNGKCWYTEARFTAEYPQLEHFRPKSCARNEDWVKCHNGYWWLAFDLENYRLAKPMPNVRKGAYFPLRERNMAVSTPGIACSRESPMFLDPTNQDDVELLGFNALGQVEPCAKPVVDLDDWDVVRIEFSIKRYGLNDENLVVARKSVWDGLISRFSEYQQVFTKARRERCAASAGRALQIRKDLAKELDPSREFSAVVLECFKKHEVGQILLSQLLSHQLAA